MRSISDDLIQSLLNQSWIRGNSFRPPPLVIEEKLASEKELVMTNSNSLSLFQSQLQASLMQ